jgi:hypothetical protein
VVLKDKFINKCINVSDNGTFKIQVLKGYYK